MEWDKDLFDPTGPVCCDESAQDLVNGDTGLLHVDVDTDINDLYTTVDFLMNDFEDELLHTDDWVEQPESEGDPDEPESEDQEEAIDEEDSEQSNGSQIPLEDLLIDIGEI